MSVKQKRTLARILVALILFVAIYASELSGLLESAFGSNELLAAFVLFLVPYLIAGYDVITRAVRNIGHGQVFDENFLMSVATIGAFALVLFPESGPHMAEGAAVMLFYQIGELFQDYAVDRSRASIAKMMDIAPDYANIERDGVLAKVNPDDVAIGDVIVVKPGERVPLDGVIVSGATDLDTAALTGEPAPRHVEAGTSIASGCVNLTGVVNVRVTKPYGESTVTRILELVESAAEKKARTESFITRFARFYTPAVVGVALLLSIVPPVAFGQPWSDWVLRGLTFLVVSCPCALVISVPLSFFGGIGGASKAGVLVKGGNHLEALAKADTVVFDKTGTLTKGSFSVVSIHPEVGVDPDRLLALAAHAEAYSDHPIALSVKEAYGQAVDQTIVTDVLEKSGHGVRAYVDGHEVLVGNDKLMASANVDSPACVFAGAVLQVAVDGRYAGYLAIADVIKDDAKLAISALHDEGVRRTVMLTGDRVDAAADVARSLGIDEFRADLLPQDKVACVEELLALPDRTGTLAFVGDGINDAPVLMRADVGIAMGALGSDAAIEAADVVLMDDKPSKIALAVRIARKTMDIVWQNIVFALGVKIVILVLAAFGVANMWMAVFGDVGVAVIAILNAMRAMTVPKARL